MKHAQGQFLVRFQDLPHVLKRKLLMKKKINVHFIHFRELASVGCTVRPAQAGYYCTPDFEICRQDFEKRGIKTGADMCVAMLNEIQVAVSRTYELVFRRI